MCEHYSKSFSLYSAFQHHGQSYEHKHNTIQQDRYSLNCERKNV